MEYKFGSFNMQNISENAYDEQNGKMIEKRDFSIIAQIIKDESFDVVALQEVLSLGAAIEYLVKNYLPGYDMKWEKPPMREGGDKRGEGFAFLWKKRRLKLADSNDSHGKEEFKPRILGLSDGCDTTSFIRPPYFARFVPKNGGFFEFRVISVHLYFGSENSSDILKRKEEYDYIIKNIYPTISTKRKYGNNREAYTIVMGDYNLNLRKYRGEAEKNINSQTYISGEYHTVDQSIVTVQDELTTLKKPKDSDDDNNKRGYSQNYDHFTFDARVFIKERIGYKARRIDAVRKYYNDDFEEYRAKVSDHVPISLRIIMNEPIYMNGGEV